MKAYKYFRRYNDCYDTDRFTITFPFAVLVYVCTLKKGREVLGSTKKEQNCIHSGHPPPPPPPKNESVFLNNNKKLRMS